MEKKRRYKKPPVQEALCEVFSSGFEWDDTIPGLFYETIKDQFSNKSQLKQFGIELNVGSSERAAKFLEKNDRIQFRKPDGSQIIQLAQDLLVINQLKPYMHFEDWFPVVKDKFSLYSKCAKPKQIEKIGIRYINRIVVPKAAFKMEDYFNCYPQLPSALGDTHGPFMIRLQTVTKHPSHQLIITFATAPSDSPESTAFALDLYDIFQKPMAPDVNELTKIANEGHENIVRAFENCIKDNLRALFEEEK